MKLNRNWTVEQRYRPLEEIPKLAISAMVEKRRQDQGYPTYHIAPSFGLLNDPNGLCYFNGEHHIFYQWTPIGPVHGLKYWYHLTTKDFVSFVDHGVAIKPNEDFDSHGVYSGGAIVIDNEVALFYTGNKRDKDWKRIPTQCMAKMSADGNIEKAGVLIENCCYTEHFRDPKVWHHNNSYFMVVGAQNRQKEGGMILYQSDDLLTWHHKGPIKTNYKKLGYMWECPDFFDISGQSVMLFSPQGVVSENDYDFKNIHSVAYIVGDNLNLETMELENHDEIKQPDYGFDFYAPQTYEDHLGRRILIAWVGLPDIDTPSVEHEWAGMLSLPRELKVVDGYLIQSPLTELTALRGDPILVKDEHKVLTGSFLLSVDVECSEFSLKFGNESGDFITFSANQYEFTLDRTYMTQLYAKSFGLYRKAPRICLKQKIEIYLDQSVIEIFINNGRHTMTSRFFINDLSFFSINGDIKVEYFPMKATSKFVL